MESIQYDQRIFSQFSQNTENTRYSKNNDQKRIEIKIILCLFAIHKLIKIFLKLISGVSKFKKKNSKLKFERFFQVHVD